MTDVFSRAKRSEVMSQIRGKDTGPELYVRSLLHKLGYRFRLHRKDIPGKPDIVLPRYKVVIFVNGCFWHQHSGCRDARPPRSNQAFWMPKLQRTRVRDKNVRYELACLGWNVITVWEC